MRSSQGTIGRLESALTRKRLERERNKTMKLNLRQRFRNWLMRDNDEPDFVLGDGDGDQAVDFQIDHESAIHFAVIPAAGGKIVQIRYYDKVKDRNLTKLHIITPDEKLEEALAHIFQIEVLSR
jgi:hypothetical protein